jgi:hypothetical protein
VYFHHLAQYQCQYRGHDQLHSKLSGGVLSSQECFSQFHASKFTQKIPKASKEEHTLDQLQEQESDSTSNIHSAAARCRHVDDDEMHIKSELAHRLLYESDVNILKMHLLNHFSYYIG